MCNWILHGQKYFLTKLLAFELRHFHCKFHMGFQVSYRVTSFSNNLFRIALNYVTDIIKMCMKSFEDQKQNSTALELIFVLVQQYK